MYASCASRASYASYASRASSMQAEGESKPKAKATPFGLHLMHLRCNPFGESISKPKDPVHLVHLIAEGESNPCFCLWRCFPLWVAFAFGDEMHKMHAWESKGKKATRKVHKMHAWGALFRYIKPYIYFF